MNKRQKLYLPLKRLIGILGSLFGIVVCFSLFWWWIFIINSIATKGHPVFSHERVGQDGKSFKIVKFRSMRVDADAHLTSYDSTQDSNVTKFGHFLRKSSLDETLQLLCILTGKMSFIGPRPLIDVRDDHITIELRRKNGAIKLKPGISGYAQINGRTDISPEGKAKLDGFYYEHFGLWLDIRIFLISIFQAFGLMKNKKKQL